MNFILRESSHKHKGGTLSKRGSAMKPIPQAHVFEDTEAVNSHWIQQELDL